MLARHQKRSAPLRCCMLPLYACATALALALLVHLATAQTQPTPWLPASRWGGASQQPRALTPPTFDDAAVPATPRVTLCTLVRVIDGLFPCRLTSASRRSSGGSPAWSL